MDELLEWHEPSERAPDGTPVLAEYHPWNDRTQPMREHVVWWYDCEWRLYPSTDDAAYVNRWRQLPSAKAPELAARVKVLEAAAADALSGWQYIRAIHGDLSGVGWDRVEHALSSALTPNQEEL